MQFLTDKLIVFTRRSEDHKKLHSPRPKSSSFFFCSFLNRHVKSQRMHFLSVLTDRVRLPLGYSKGCAPLPDMWKSCVPSCCFVFCTIIIAKVCEKFVNFERIFLYEPSVTQPKQRQKSDTESWRTVQNVK